MSRTVLAIPAELSVENGASGLVTAQFQSVLDAARDAEGARVVVPAGTYRVGSIRLYSDTELHLQEGTRIQGSDDVADYTDWDVSTTLAYTLDPEIIRIQSIPAHYVKALITAADAENVAITGEAGSVIDGVDCTDPAGEEGFRGAMLIRMCRCQNVTLTGYTVERAANWSHQMDSCDNIVAENVTILGGHDGFNVHHCNNVTIRRCTIKTGDDCVAGFDARNVLVDDCLLNTACNAIRLGCANLLVSKCRFVGPGEYSHILDGGYHMHAAVKYYSPVGDAYRDDACNWRLVDCSFENPGRLLNYDFGSPRGYMTERPLLDVHFQDCTVKGATMTSFFKGSDDAPAMLEFRNCELEYAPDADSAGKPFVQMNEADALLQENVTYACASGESLRGARVVEQSEVVAEVLEKK